MIDNELEYVEIKNRRIGAVMFRCELNAELRGATLGVKLGFAVQKAFEPRASLDGASLDGASLDGASLDGASLIGASLIGARLDGASLNRASLDGAKIRDGITINRAPLQISGLDYPVIIFDAHMQIGCEFHALSDWRAFDDRRIAQMDGKAALKFWRAHGAALLALAASDNCGVDVADVV